jgi:hypothetical protein
MPNSRMPTDIGPFVSQIKVLDNLQLSPGKPPNIKKYQDWFWTQEESTRVTKFRTDADAYYKQIISGRHCPPEVKDLMKILIREFMAYDHGKTDPHSYLIKLPVLEALLIAKHPG